MVILSNSGELEYGIKTFLIDTKKELSDIEIQKLHPGSIVFVADTSTSYILNNKLQWIQLKNNNNPILSHIICDGGSAYPL